MSKRHKTFHQNDAVSASPTQQMGNSGSFTLKISLLSKTQIRELWKTLLSELQQVRAMITRIESGLFGNVASFKSQNVINRSGLGLGLGLVPSFSEKDRTILLKECGKILSKLLKHKYAYVFNVPVDAVALNILDYHTIVTHPMDLGTVKANLAKRVYLTPMEFANDVRLTFNNALLYNPKTNEVHEIAAEMLAIFEKLFQPIQQKIDEIFVNREMGMKGQDSGVVDEEMITNANPNVQLLPEVITKPVESMQQTSVPVVNQQTPVPVVNQQQQFPMSPHVVGTTAVKQPKPGANDLNKRDMSFDERQKLEADLESIPEEKMPHVLQIIRKRNERFGEDGGEIEVDLGTLDTETLWDLDRFVMNNNPIQGGADPSTPATETDMGAMSDKNDFGKKPKDNEEEDVDICDDMPATNYPPVVIEKDVVGVGEDHAQGQDQKDNANGNESSSSGSSGRSGSNSSSSGDSDSGSSSGSDADEAQP